MNFYLLLLLLKKTLVFWLFNFIFGLPVVFYLKNKLPKNIFGITQFIGFSFLTILLFWLKFIGLNQDIRIIVIFVSTLSFIFTSLLIAKDFNNGLTLKKIILKLGNILKNDLYQYLIYVLFVLILTAPQRTFPPYIPSYETNHDPIFVLFYSKNIFGDTIKNNLDLVNPLFKESKTTNYPLGFSSILNFYHILFNLEYYYTAHFLNILIYSISFVFLPLFFARILKRGSIKFAYLASFFGLISYLPIQYLNQSFYGSISLTPFLLALIFNIYEIFRKEKKISYFLIILSLTTSVIMYSLTVFLWVGMLILILLLMKLIRKSFGLNIKYILISIVTFVLLTIPFLAKSINLFYKGLFVNTKGTESSFFGAMGNSYDYQSLLTATSSWFSIDYRLNDSPTAYKYSILFFVIISIFVFSSLNIVKKNIKKNFFQDIFLLLITLILTWCFAFFILRSPYYFGKTIFYSSIFLTTFIYLLVFMILFKKKRNYFTSNWNNHSDNFFK